MNFTSPQESGQPLGPIVVPPLSYGTKINQSDQYTKLSRDWTNIEGDSMEKRDYTMKMYLDNQ